MFMEIIMNDVEGLCNGLHVSGRASETLTRAQVKFPATKVATLYACQYKKVGMPIRISQACSSFVWLPSYIRRSPTNIVPPTKSEIIIRNEPISAATARVSTFTSLASAVYIGSGYTQLSRSRVLFYITDQACRTMQSRF